MESMSVSYMPGDPLLIDKIVCELKSQGIFDSFRKECISDVDTKPAYQNLRQRVEGSVGNFLSKQKWKPDMNKNQVREMLRKSIQDSGFLETGVERIVDQVVNPKMNTVFLPKVTEVVYKYFGLEKPQTQTEQPTGKLEVSVDNLLPKDLEAVSPETVPLEKKGDKPNPPQDLDTSIKNESESSSFEPIKEQEQLMQEETSMDSHLSGFSGLVSHDSNHSEGQQKLQIDTSMEISKHSSDEQSFSVEDQKMDITDGSGQDMNPKILDEISSSSTKIDVKKEDGLNKLENVKEEKKEDRKEKKHDKSKKDESKNVKEDKRDKDRHRSDKYKSKSDSNSVKKDDSKRSDKKDKYSSKDRDKSKDSSSSRKYSSSSSRNDKEKTDKEKNDKDKKDKDKNEKDRDRYKSSSSSKHRSHSSSSKDRHSKDKDKSSKDKDKSRDKSKDNKTSTDDKTKSHENDRKSSSHRDKYRDRKDSKKKSNNKDDHYSSKIRTDRRSTDRDSNDGSGLKSSSSNCDSNSSSQTSSKQTEKTQNGSTSSTTDSTNSDSVETMHKKEFKFKTNSEDNISGNGKTIFKLIKPQIASNIHEAKKIMKIRKQLKKIEQDAIAREQAKSLLKIDGNYKFTSLEENLISNNCVKEEIKLSSLDKPVTAPSISVSVDAWDALEAKLNQNVNFDSYYDPEIPPNINKPAPNLGDIKQTVFTSTELSEHLNICNSSLNDSMERCDKIINIDVSQMEDEEISIITNPEPKEVSNKRVDDESEHIYADASLDSCNNSGNIIPEPIEESNRNNFENSITYQSDVSYEHEKIQDNMVTQSDISSNVKNDADFLFFSESPVDVTNISKYRTTIDYNVSKLKNEINLIETNIQLSIFNNIPPTEIKDVNKENVVVGIKRKVIETCESLKKTKNNNVIQDLDDKFTLPLSPAESDKSIEKKSDSEVTNENVIKRGTRAAMNSKRYSNEDLYKPRPIITRTSRRRGAKSE